MNRWGQVVDACLDYSTSTFPRNYSPSISYSFSHQTMWFVPGVGRQRVRPGPSKHKGLSSYFQWLVWKWATSLCRTNQSLFGAFNQKDQKQFLSSSRISSYQDQRVWSYHAAHHVERTCLKIKLHWRDWYRRPAGTTHSWQPYQKSLKFQLHKPTVPFYFLKLLWVGFQSLAIENVLLNTVIMIKINGQKRKSNQAIQLHKKCPSNPKPLSLYWNRASWDENI